MNVILLILIVVLAAYVTGLLWPGVIYLKKGNLVYRPGFRASTIKVEDLVEILYDYHAVVGFVAVFEFNDRHGRNLVVSHKAPGIKAVLCKLEELLEGFSIERFNREFDAGDVVDSITVWEKQCAS